MGNPKVKIAVFVVAVMGLVFLLSAALVGAENQVQGNGKMEKKRLAVLVGASVGKEWEISGLPRRADAGDYDFESIAVYQYDKTEALEEVLMRPKRKFRLTRSYVKGLFAPSPRPADMIILKECAAYFPGDLESYKALMKKWVRMARDSGKEVMLATVVPVTESHARGKQGRLESILRFNDWLREYARVEKIGLLDLEAALRKDERSRLLRDELTSGDGLHLNKKAYALLDKIAADACRAR